MTSDRIEQPQTDIRHLEERIDALTQALAEFKKWREEKADRWFTLLADRRY